MTSLVAVVAPRRQNH